MGKYDFVKAALQALGAEIHFHRCAIRPGKPVLFASFVFQGTLRYFFGVPGNPVSTAVGMRFFILPFLQHWRGQRAEAQRWLPLLTEVKKPEGLRCFFKAEIVNDGLMSGVRILPGQASYMVSPLLIATSWVILPEEGETIAAGTPVEVLDL